MKVIAEDFKDKLAGTQDKHDACDAIKKNIEELGLRCNIQRRKLAGGHKIYFVIVNDVVDYGIVAQLRGATKILIRNFFPDAHLTSGGPSGWTIAEY